MSAPYEITGRLDGAEAEEATVAIDRERGLFTVQPNSRRRAFSLPLATVAEMVVTRVVRAELIEKASKTAKRRVPRGMLRG